MPATPHVLFAGGGSASHLYPGMAVAEHLRRLMPTALVTFAGTGAARERHTVRIAGHHYSTIPTHPMPRNPLQAVRFVTDNVAGYCAARWMLREQRVSLVVGLGGSTSVAVVRAAVARGIPVVLLEQNAVPGRTTRWLSRAAAMVCAAFEEVRPHLHVQAPMTVTGNPCRMVFEDLYKRTLGQAASVRADLTERNAAGGLATNGPRRQNRLVILGGSGGARSLNESIPPALKRLGDRLHNWQIVHQTGDGQLQETESRYAQLGMKALAVTHIDEIASVLFASDLVVSRASGTTLAELALAGVPALLVPFPQAADNHQTANAKVFTSASACRMVDESQQSGALDAALARELDSLVSDHHLRVEMGRNMQKLARPQAASQIAGAIADQLCGGSVSGLMAA
ncbi:UDP-N-acetylglucosamine--N-acetylmuramyl-(pentapeptide) pyrophosphoryl-undecaprenol N-acetylglucosamine transferase [Lacipirellula sp.]|uniref:UDP-N-acetylglucosamine--N-acetylmuramyl- (pentapeptide) pyrophosphoryl-undecaprenol N-acetylglucosamine transferase n=1 Tax=Lacipirellula sp. TaxID=2691419 RepID=UPI003D1262EA